MGDSDDDSSSNSSQECDCHSKDVVRPKELVHKCASDPGKDGGDGSLAKVLYGRTSTGIVSAAASQRYPSGATTRKCVLTLDGYSYVIGKEIDYYFLLYSHKFAAKRGTGHSWKRFENVRKWK